MPHIERIPPDKIRIKQMSSPESMSEISSPFLSSQRERGSRLSGSLYDRITGFSNEKVKPTSYYSDSSSSSPIDYARRRLETTVLDVDNVVHSPKRFLDCAITPIKREKKPERGDSISKTLSLTSSEGESREKSTANEWRAVIDPVTKRTYFYNRLTRVTKWKLPKGAVLLKERKSSARNPSKEHFVSIQHRQSNERKELGIAKLLSSPKTSSQYSSTSLSEAKVDAKSVIVETNAIKRPQDTTLVLDRNMTSGLIFCMYCGLECGSMTGLESHIRSCSSFIRMQKPDLLSAQLDLEEMLFNLWSETKSEDSIQPTGSPRKREDTVPSSSQELFMSPSKEVTMDSPITRVHRDSISTPKFTTHEHKRIHEVCIEKKRCPFCDEILVGGDQFSSHLLVCKERRRRRNLRRTPRESPAVEEFSPRIKASINKTPGRRMPWE